MRGTTDIGPPTIYLRIERLQVEARARGWSTARDLAEGIGVTEASISRLLDADPEKRQMPGPAFIAAVLCAFPYPQYQFRDFFQVAPAEVSMRRAS